MNENDVALAVTAWTQDVIPELQGASHFITAEKNGLPDVVVDTSEKNVVLRDPRFPQLSEVEQIALRVFEVDLAFMVESTASPDAAVAQAETEQLRDFGKRLEASLLSDVTLGGRVPVTSPLFAINYRLPFVEYADGTRGRQMTMAIAVADPIERGDQ